MSSVDAIPVYDGKRPLTKEHANAIVDALKALQSIEGVAPIEVRRTADGLSIFFNDDRLEEIWWGKIADPNSGSGAYTDNRYFVDRALITAAAGSGGTRDPEARLFPLVQTSGKYDVQITATNFAELWPDPATPETYDAAYTSHLLAVGTLVQVFTCFDGGVEGNLAPKKIHYFYREPQHKLFPVLCAATSGSAGNLTTKCSYLYVVSTLAGVALSGSTPLAPLEGRPDVGPCLAADHAGTATGFGIAYYDLSDPPALVLLSCNEVFDVATFISQLKTYFDDYYAPL